MPYIPLADREVFDRQCEDIGSCINKIGELNYVITKIITEYLRPREPQYHYYNAIIGVLECAKQEMYRRVVSKYEDKKRKKHGDVYD